ncbi:MAG TPA: 23S rRNA (uracil(1939)-C(5))-methyltransferase RlmD [Elusimicrobiota bacterium]|nr:23S rRNA (uracil(1939)-C(5))-methyltransferase RlmD [Elusimicrobiota bacterium]
MLSIESLATGGDSVARDNRYVIFVPYGAPGDRVKLAHFEHHQRFTRARIVEILEPSPERVSPRCPVFYKPGDGVGTFCGGCDWQHLKPEYQLKAKETLFKESLHKIGGLVNPRVESLLPSPDPWRYRNKVQIPFEAKTDGGVQAGFYSPGSHTVVPFDDCPVQTEISVRIYHTVLDWVRRENVRIYQPATGQGWLRHLYIRTNSAQQALVALITNSAPFPNSAEFCRSLRSQNPGVVSVYQNINMQRNQIILGNEWKHLEGSKSLPESILGLKWALSPGSFFQVNHGAAEKLFSTVIEWIAPTRMDFILELYSGVGVLSLSLAAKARAVWGIEENPTAIQDAWNASRLNGISNVRFWRGSCETVLSRRDFRKMAPPRFQSVVLDPPRAGCTPQVLRNISFLKPDKIIYVSCDPATLARDIKILTKYGYHLQRSVPVDLFPQTSHIESVNLLVRRSNPSQKISDDLLRR